MRKILILIPLLLLSSKAFTYEVSFEGIAVQEIRELISSISQLHTKQDHPPPTFFTLKRRAEADKKSIINALHSFGLYEANVCLIYQGTFPDTTVLVHIDPGPQYIFNQLSIVDSDGTPWWVRERCLNLRVGSPAYSSVILDTEEQILAELGACGYPLACIADRQVVVNQESKEVNVTYIVEPGPIAYFGAVCIEGLRKVKPGFIKRRIGWKKGELYHPKAIDCTDAFIQESGLFTYVVVRPGEAVEEDGTLPMIIQVEEKKFRHIGAGVSYSTDESAGALLQWSHDNLRGWGDALAFVGEYSEVVKRATLLYGIPDFYGRNQDLSYSAELRREDTPGFIEREISLLVRFSKKVSHCFFYNVGGRYERLISTKSNHDANYHLLSLPVQVRFDTSNRLLNPTCGTTIAYFGTPYQSIFDSNIFFLKQELFAVTYHPLCASGRFVLAASTQLGSITCQSLNFVPAPKRFFAGSSTTLRGYRYLTVSPLEGTKPIGGRSIFVFSIEPRMKIWLDNLYFAAFFDMGNVFRNPFPVWDEKMLRSIGCGLRYFTPLGPFRLDIAFPIDKRKHIDNAFQIYASIGQTF